MLAGALIAGATDLTYSLPGYIWVTICAISTAMYLLLIRALKDSTGVVLHVFLMEKEMQQKKPDQVVLRMAFSFEATTQNTYHSTYLHTAAVFFIFCCIALCLHVQDCRRVPYCTTTMCCLCQSWHPTC